MIEPEKAKEWVIVLALIAFTLQLIRLSMELIQTVSESEVAAAAESSSKSSSNHKSKEEVSKATGISSLTSYGAGIEKTASAPLTSSSTEKPSYGSVVATDEEQQPLTSSSSTTTDGTRTAISRTGRPPLLSDKQRNAFFFTCWSVLFALFGVAWMLAGGKKTNTIFPDNLLLFTAATLFLEDFLLFANLTRHFYGYIQRFFHTTASVLLWCDYTVLLMKYNDSVGGLDIVLLVAATLNVLLTVAEGWMTAHPRHVDDVASHVEGDEETSSSSSGSNRGKKTLSRAAIITLVKPYVWPDATDCTAVRNRMLAIGTWVCVISSKVCGLVSPLFLGWATTALAHQDYRGCIRYSILYSFISWLGSTFKEGQSLMYLKVAQAAFVLLSETAFAHLHSLSLDWHLRKKLGEVLRSMDRGIAACDTLMKYLFLWLVPALAECLVVCIIFASYFQYLPLAVTVFYFVFVYITWTIAVTVWRKKYRKSLVQHDNEWHDIFTDSMINFETIKCFTAEKYEMKRFSNAVSRFQTDSVDVQGSLSFLNISQQVLMKVCLALALSLSAMGIQKRVDCCIQAAGCESGVSECCQNVSTQQCPGMQVGDFVSVLTYTLNLFAPLNFLGSVYNAIVMAVVDLSNMSDLLAEDPDVVDTPDAIELPLKNIVHPDTAIEFDNVFFHYPSQSDDQGLKGLSFTMKRGTTTAIVGPTGAGKTTVSRLLFRFYDVLGGAVKFNGIDVRSVTQNSLRSSIGVVPQAASMFNDTIRNNLLYGRQTASQEELEQAARDAQLLDFIESLDEGWDTVVGDRGLKLSGGEKQRLAIARCLLKDPPFVLLDEATSALDTITEQSVQEALDRLGADRTVLVIAHRLGTIRNADNIVVLKDGRAAEQGKHDELLARNGLYADMWNMQLHSTSTAASGTSLSDFLE